MSIKPEKESNIQRKMMLKLSNSGSRIFRNNVGKAWIGDKYEKFGSDILVFNARRFHAGLGVGTSDLVGWTPITITPDMVGKKLAVFTGVECKASKNSKATAHQSMFIDAVNDAGGLGIISSNPESIDKDLMSAPIFKKE